MTAFSLKRSIKQKFQAGHTENESGQRDLTDFTITRSLPYSVTDCGYGLPWPSFPHMHSHALLPRKLKLLRMYGLLLSIKHFLII